MAGKILCVDIGNSNTVFGIFDSAREGEPVLKHWRTVTRRDRTSDELGIFLLGFLESASLDPASIGSCVYSSVVPSFNPIVERMARDYFQAGVLRVQHDLKLPITFDYPRPAEIGADRVVNAVAAHVRFGGDLIVIDLGTATTFCVLHQGSYVGGSIAPGLKLSMESLSRATAQLPPIEFRNPPDGAIGKSTTGALQSGFFYGWVGLLREITDRVRRHSPDRTYRVIATGGLCGLIHAEEPSLFDEVDPLMTLHGLQTIYRYQQ
ncbi:MAG: type III pantothenate kinase [Spirochaetales bacterium]|nr:type III pantothenate kinase [Leptospiraceae bacterium]MCP5480852.1 type III pantothenate kinase [Spirochaetales bacterium]